MRRVFAWCSAIACAGLVSVGACAPAKQHVDSAVASVDSSAGRDKPGVRREPAPNGAGQGASAPVADTAQLALLEREARAIARTTGCSSASACRTAPVGNRPCGGPRTYIVYCAASTDTVALFAKLRELERAETAYNANAGMMSTCEFRLPPTAILSGERCQAAPAGP